ncbi:MAG TPA: hypothetical protein VMV92_17180 [Streptosporangiaceae bacterium]|nr:hypothetical protein [Streptosporangiaceae bacterium]
MERVTTLTGRLFHVRYTPRGMSYLLHRVAHPRSALARRTAERDEAVIKAMRDATWAKSRP